MQDAVKLGIQPLCGRAPPRRTELYFLCAERAAVQVAGQAWDIDAAQQRHRTFMADSFNQRVRAISDAHLLMNSRPARGERPSCDAGGEQLGLDDDSSPAIGALLDQAFRKPPAAARTHVRQTLEDQAGRPGEAARGGRHKASEEPNA